MSRPAAFAMVVAVVLGAAPLSAQEEPGSGRKAYVVVFDFRCPQSEALGKQLADSVRLYLSRHGEYEVIDRLTTAEASGPLPADVEKAKVVELMANKLAANLAIYGTVTKSGQEVSADVRLIDRTDPNAESGWQKTFRDSSERARGQVARQIVEAVRTRNEWAPPQYGDELEPKDLGKPLNRNGDFESGYLGWAAPDNVSTFIEPGPADRGKVLRIRTDLLRDPWLEYQRKLRFGQADPNHPPQIARDTSLDNSVAALEGVHYRGEWIAAEKGQRYWLAADMKGKSADIFFPKIYVKGYMDFSDKADALPEQTLVELKMTAKDFAGVGPARQKELLAEDAKKHPDRYRREVFRWYLACRNEQDTWQHYAAPCPPRGGLPANVQWLQVQVYAYWPPGEFRFDNVNLYKDPAQKAPLPEEPMRTSNIPRTMPAK